MNVPARDRDILRRLAEEQAKIAALPVHREKAELWRRLERPGAGAPDGLDQRDLLERDERGRRADAALQPIPGRGSWSRGCGTLLYQWRHLPGDMIVDDYLSCPLVIHNTRLWHRRRTWTSCAPTRPAASSRATFTGRSSSRRTWTRSRRRWSPTTRRPPRSATRPCAACFGDILPVRKVGIKGSWFAPWDELIRWWGVQEAMMDLVLRPEMVNAVMERLVDAYLRRARPVGGAEPARRSTTTTRASARAATATPASCPAQPYDPAHPRPHNLWGCATAQIFSDVSPQHALGVRAAARAALAGALGADLLWLLRAAATSRWTSCGASPTCARSP